MAWKAIISTAGGSKRPPEIRLDHFALKISSPAIKALGIKEEQRCALVYWDAEQYTIALDIHDCLSTALRGAFALSGKGPRVMACRTPPTEMNEIEDIPRGRLGYRLTPQRYANKWGWENVKGKRMLVIYFPIPEHKKE